ncbi:hypothetical protein DCCM_0216 [Desulfocucumis palustris]|uniref:Gingipain domain-containing protein n=1 Tax=Desulfocucumis palustris TaxID=1898651 RepID=A0A2L2X782_9FIRM|nr:C25 family cysteine peptidase [Desulfocucumis palustris]GBF32025.1 hypothetical protein DCCM_0216 [Desulfocucumis palustris]
MRSAKKLLTYLLILVIAIVSPVCPALAASNEGDSKGFDVISKTYKFGTAIVGPKDLSGFNSVNINSLKFMGKPGHPMIPFKSVVLLIPKGKSIKKVNISLGEQKLINNVKIKPAANIYPTFSKSFLTTPNTKIYKSDAAYPGNSNSEPMVQWKSAYQLLFINLYPVQFFPSQEQIKVAESIKIDISLKDSSPTNSFANVKPTSLDKKAVSQLVDNPEILQTYDSNDSNFFSEDKVNQQAQSSVLIEGNADYVVITSRDFVNDFQPLVDWKMSKGLTAATVTVEDIYTNYPGVDQPEQIRNFISDAYLNNQSLFFLLGGDADGGDEGSESGDNIVPVRKLWGPFSDYPSPIAADLYYACLNGDFDGNGNRIYGEPGDNPDLLAEVYVGRAPIDSHDEASNFVNKTINYEKANKNKSAWMIGEKLSEDDPHCSVEYAAIQQDEMDPSLVVKTLKELRDSKISDEYVSFYYKNSDFFKQAFINNALLLAHFTKLLVKYVPELNNILSGNGCDSIINQEDIDNLLDLTTEFHNELTVINIPADNLQDIEAKIYQLQKYITTLEGKTIQNALEMSPYVDQKSTNSLADETWGGDCKDEIKNGSEKEFSTKGFPSGYTVNTLYDRDYEGNDWPKSELVDNVINTDPNLINHLGHADITKLMKMENGDVDSLTNTEPFFLYSQGCYAGSFDNMNTDGTINSSDCISEHLVTGSNGAFATIVNSRYGWFTKNDTRGSSQFFDRQFWNSIFGEKIYNLGAALNYSKETNLTYLENSDSSNYIRYCYYEINLLGDPETKLTIKEQGSPVLRINNTKPATNQKGVKLDETITVKFNKAVTKGDNFQQILVKNSSDEPVATNNTISSDTLSIDPIELLKTNMAYTVYIPASAVKDKEGNKQENSYYLYFTTGTNDNVIMVDSSYPEDGEVDIPLKPMVKIEFDREIVKGKDFKKIKLNDYNNKSVPYKASIKKSALTITPKKKLNENESYVLTIPANAVKDKNGASLATDHIVTFTTTD